jgi:phosphohistidine phosphatase SixA
VTLSEEGRRQAREVGEWFKGVIQENTRVIVSPYKRARDTADVVVSAVGADRLVSLTENIFLGE